MHDDETEGTDKGSDWVQKNDDGTTTIILQYPIKGKTQTFGEIRLKRPTAADLEAGDSHKGDMRKMLAAIVSMSDPRFPIAVLRQVDLVDLNRIGAYFEEVTQGDDEKKS